MLWLMMLLACDGNDDITTTQVQDVDVPEFGRADLDCVTPTDELRVPYNEDAMYQLRYCWNEMGADPGQCEMGSMRIDEANTELYMTCEGNIGSLHLTWVAP